MIGVDDLITWLREQVDDDERAIRRLAEGYRRYVCDDGHVEEPIEKWSDGTDRLPNHHNTWLLIHDQAERLAEVEAKRRILDEHFECSLPNGIMAGTCTTCDNYAWPCPTVRLLAQPYAGRDGWQDEWTTR